MDYGPPCDYLRIVTEAQQNMVKKVTMFNNRTTGRINMAQSSNNMPATKMPTITDVFHYFSDNSPREYKLAQFKNDWSKLTDQDKSDLKTGLGDSTLNY